jgi:hypothetical protein
MKLLDAGTSIGANIEELHLAEGVARETRFWLRLIAATDPPLENELRPLLREATEFVAMLTALLKTARASQSRGTQSLA